MDQELLELREELITKVLRMYNHASDLIETALRCDSDTAIDLILKADDLTHMAKRLAQNQVIQKADMPPELYRILLENAITTANACIHKKWAKEEGDSWMF